MLFEVAKGSKTDFNSEDYEQLCMSGKRLISENEYEEYKEYKHRIRELESKVEQYENAKLGNISKGENSALSHSEQYDAQLEAQRFLMSQMPHWSFPNGYGERGINDKPKQFSTISVDDENGKIIHIVLKSYKKQSEPFKINPEEWDYIIKKEARLFIYDGSSIREINLLDLIRNQSNVSITFSTDNLEIEDRINTFAEVLHYFKDLHFDFESFNIPKRAKSIQAIYNKVEGMQAKTNDTDL